VKNPNLRRSFGNAFAGLWAVWRTQRNARIEVCISLVVIVMGLLLRVGVREWAILVLTMGLVLTAECLNTVIEALVDLVSPDYHDLAKVAKDASAGAVLLLSIFSVIIGLLILGPPLVQRLLP
jgi:diacylglycerol kinase